MSPLTVLNTEQHPSVSDTPNPDSPTDTAPELSSGKRFKLSNKEADEKQVDSTDKFSGAKEAGIKPAFLAKCELINEAIKEIGMGRYQIELFFTAGE